MLRYKRPKRMYSNSYIRTFSIPNTLYNFLNYHNMLEYLDIRDVHERYSSLMVMLEYAIGELYIYYNNSPGEDIDNDKNTLYDNIKEYIFNELEMLDTLSYVDISTFIIMLKDLAEYILERLTITDIVNKEYTIRDIYKDMVVVEVCIH